MKRLDYLLSTVISYFGVIVVGLLSFGSLFSTYIIPVTYEECSAVDIRYSFVSLILIPFLIWFLIAVVQKNKTINLDVVRIIGSLIILFVGLIWILLNDFHPVGDQETCLTLARALHDNDAERFAHFSYLDRYPFQSGLVLYFYLIGLVFGYSNWAIFRLINLIWLVIAYNYLYKIVSLLFKSRTVLFSILIIPVLFIPFSFFSHFIYGNVPSFSLCLMAIYYQIKYLVVNREKKYLLLHLVLYFFALILRLNSLLFLLTSIFVWLTSKRPAQSTSIRIFVSVALVFVYLLASVLPVNLIQNSTKSNFSNNIPKVAWIAMGMQEGPRGSGWYNNYIEDAYWTSSGDTNTISEVAGESIRSSLSHFASDPAYCLEFYLNKILSQWSEPTFQTFWLTYTGYGPKPVDSVTGGLTECLDYDSVLQNSLRSGFLHKLIVVYLDALQSVIYILAACGIAHSRKRFGLVEWLPLVAFFAGLLFHILWEAKSLYVIFSFVMLIPYSGVGLSGLLKRSGSNAFSDHE